MELAETPKLLDVQRLLESSEPRPRVGITWWLGGAFVFLIVFMVGLNGQQTVQARQVLGFIGGLVMTLSVVALMVFSVYSARLLRHEHHRVERIAELIQLRRWQDAAVALEGYLSAPARTPSLRAQALVLLTPVLARLQRFGDALTVQNYLIDEQILDPGANAAIRVGRTMTMLHEDHLFDADRSISELRRSPVAGSAALGLVELYRDVKTGHPAEAIELFEQKLSMMRDQLGHRVADAYVLAARAYDLLGQEEKARSAFHSATLLSPVGDLFLRYPETAKLAPRYQPALAPPEAM
jgi:tetratricopeptide (TPR) repeat protein